MIDGIYSVYFRSSNDEGRGIVVISDGKVNGGDFTHCYKGTVSNDNGTVKTELTVRQFNDSQDSIFGPLRLFKLEAKGEADNEGFHFKGHVVEQPRLEIFIRGEFIEPLA